MRVLIWGSRSLTWKHLPLIRKVASHALLAEAVPLDEWLEAMSGPDPEFFGVKQLPDSEPLVLLNCDGPPGRERGAVGADKLALLACMERWPERRRVKWFPPEPKPLPDGTMETWPQAARRRDIEAADARPARAYCVHTNLDASKGSIITAEALTARGIGYDYVRVSGAGELLGVERR